MQWGCLELGKRVKLSSGPKVMFSTVKKKLFPKISWPLLSMAEAKMERPFIGCRLCALLLKENFKGFRLVFLK